MKKLLALVLALVMSMSLVTISNAAFKDADKIDHKEAVEVMNALGVINGMPDGSFAPAGTVTRAEMAKMITIISLGDIDAAAFTGTVTDLKDINGHWAEGYIKYCYSQGVIAGRGDGTFAPNANVTAVEAAKMLLVAIGYNSDVQGYVGADWSINVIRDAQISKFFEKLSVTSTKVLTRDEAAQMIYNAVKANSIEKTPTITVGTSEVQYTYRANGHPLLSKTFNAKEFVGVFNTVRYADSNKKYTYTGTSAFENKADSSDTYNNFVTKTDYSDFLGEEVTVIQKTEVNGDKTVLGIYATGKSTVIKTPVSALEVDGAKLKINGTKYEIVAPVTTTLAVADSYDTIKLIDADGDGKLDDYVLTAVDVKKVTYVSAKEIIAGSTYKFEDNKIASGLAKDDYVTIVENTDGSYTIEKLEAIEGKVTADKTSDNKVQVNGTWYNDNRANLALGSTYKFYAVNGVVVAGSTKVISGATINNLVMVLDHETGTLENRMIVMDATGTKKTVAIDKDGVTVPTDGALYTFEETSKGYKLTAAATIGTDYTWTAGVASDFTAATGSTTATFGNGTTKEIADNAVIFVFGATDNSGTVLTGKQLKSLASGTSDGQINTASKGFYTSKVNGLERVSYAGVQTTKVSELGATSGNSLYGYVTANSYEAKLGDDTYVTYSIWNGESNVTVFEKGTTARTKGTVLKYDSIDSESKITGVAPYVVTNTGFNNGSAMSEVGYVQGIEDKYIYVDGDNSANSLKLTSDTKYLYVDSTADTADGIGIASGEIVLADKYGSSSAPIYKDNVIVVSNAAKEAVLVVVDVKNNMTNAANATRTATAPTVANATVTLSKTSNIKAGDAIDITVTANAAVSTATVTVSNAKLADGTNSITIPNMAAGETFKVTVFADGAGNVSFT